MDRFTYELKIKEIDTYKYLKNKEALMRDMLSQAESSKWGYGTYTSDNIAEQVLLYKCASKCLQVYDINRLPDELGDKYNNWQIGLIKHYFTEGCTYEALVDTFKYNTKVRIANINADMVKRMSLIIKDNTIPFTYTYEFNTSAKYTQLHTDIVGMGVKYSSIFELENVKRQLPTTTFTFLEELLANAYANVKTTDKDKVLAAAQATVDNLAIVTATFISKL